MKAFAGLLAALWSLTPITRPEPPAVQDAKWVRNPIDRFILARLEAQGLKPAPEADPQTLRRRMSLDLIGLASDQDVDELLASPHYGEHWARFWLDQARYADSDGYRGDAFRPYAWRWRDWVVEAFNSDKPFDQFTIEQIAGDLLPHATVDQKVATGFNRNTLTNREGGTDPEQFRVEAVMDRANTFSVVWLGLTAGCAQCHDHKFDPITQKDYYQLFAFFNTAEEATIDAPLAGEIGPHFAAKGEYDRKRRELLEQYRVAPLQAEWEKRMLEAAENPGKWLEWDHAFDDLRTSMSDGEKILRMPPPEREPRQKSALTDYFLANYARVIDKKRAKELNFDALRKSLAELKLPPLAEALILREENAARKTHLLDRGDYRSPKGEVQPGTPGVLHRLDANGRATRLDLARWVTSPENPLTARVIVNRVWQQYFGRGLVKTSENFGTQGDTPSHPELLDWLASEFMENGWSFKHLHKLIVTSATYRQSSAMRAEDPENKLFSRQSRMRLTAETIRDNALLASGLLDRKVGGPVVAEGYRRGLYLKRLRNQPQPFLANFDAPNGYAPVCRRAESTTPLQALNLLNDPVFADAARALALRVMREGTSFEERLDRAFVLTAGRTPTADERGDLRKAFDRQNELLAAKPEAVEKLMPKELGSAEAAAWSTVASILLNTDEFITRE